MAAVPITRALLLLAATAALSILPTANSQSVFTCTSTGNAQSMFTCNCIATSQPIFNCTYAGNFSNADDCSSYFACTATADPETFEPTAVTCPPPAMFDAITARCIVPPAPIACSDFRCTSEGLFAYPYNCSMYVMCEARAGGGFHETRRACPPPSQFDAATGLCSLAELPNCPVIACVAAGWFPYAGNCKKFYMCSLKAGGAGYSHSVHVCPGKTMFDKNSRKCSFTAKC